MAIKYLNEAKIILPLFDNSGGSLQDLHRALADRLIKEFGGFTVYHSFGAGGDPIVGEPVMVYIIGAEPNEANNQCLYSIASQLLEQARQQSIYICDFDSFGFLFDAEAAQELCVPILPSERQLP